MDIPIVIQAGYISSTGLTYDITSNNCLAVGRIQIRLGHLSV